MQFFLTRLRDRLLLPGLVLLALSLSLFSLPLFFRVSEDTHLPIFIGTYLCSLTYYIWCIQGIREAPRELHRHYKVLSALIFLVSAYALNRCMEVFADSPTWLCILLVVLGANYLATFFFDRLHRALQLLVLGLLGVAVVLFAYLAVYLFPIYPISIPGLLAFGVSLHTFLPIALVYLTVRLGYGLAGGSSRRWWAFGLGALLSVATVLVYTALWSSRVERINRDYAEALADGSDELPVWMQVARTLPQDALTEQLLKTDLVYTLPDWNEDGFWRMPSRSLGELTKLHDPLVVMASLFTNPVRLGTEERLQLLKSQFGARHHTEERLWTGIDLTTESVRTQVRLWPTQRIAYTEQLMTVYNHLRPQRWGAGPQEAIYTFRLPEGGVVSSLSLWINGREEKGVLTTKEKADTAYRTIVDVQLREVRDPSVVHWQEGNRVTVRVFPVNAGERRDFRIGVTAPLRKEGSQLVYESLTFEGPDASGAHERVQLKTDGGAADDAGRQVAFRGGRDAVAYEGRFRGRWTYTLPDKGLSASAFAFKGRSYRVQAYTPEAVPVTVADVYLDLNNSWTEAEFDDVLDAAAGRKVWVWDEGMVAVDDANRDELFRRLGAYRFSLFPVFRIARPASALLVSKNGGAGPNLADLKEHPWFGHLKAFSQRAEPVVLFNLGTGLTPYLEALQQYRFFRYQQGSVADLRTALAQGRFRLPAEAEDRVALPVAGMELLRENGPGDPAAPDHLMRLFTYNHLLRAYGRQGIDNRLVDTALVAAAKEAYIVTPVSSLVVLETARDYERFNIDRSVEGLRNATLKATGAVPEPHEWVLLIIGVIIAFYLWIRSKA